MLIISPALDPGVRGAIDLEVCGSVLRSLVGGGGELGLVVQPRPAVVLAVVEPLVAVVVVLVEAAAVGVGAVIGAAVQGHGPLVSGWLNRATQETVFQVVEDGVRVFKS